MFAAGRNPKQGRERGGAGKDASRAVGWDAVILGEKGRAKDSKGSRRVHCGKGDSRRGAGEEEEEEGTRGTQTCISARVNEYACTSRASIGELFGIGMIHWGMSREPGPKMASFLEKLSILSRAIPGALMIAKQTKVCSFPSAKKKNGV
ncbi:uncharacterized protein UTRI_10249 [Ustilago trichophora]|uniref:Uncharacterized protein n=1 Tax=Ustilago trichophora TaxID=86804 RepID=A0A5C3EL70_9BASI|nr:uncharacterized protein UTRI_10249 [Ustilago trichophora]